MNLKTNKRLVLILCCFGVVLFLLVINLKFPGISIFEFKSVPSLKIYRKTLDNWILDPVLCPKIQNFPRTTLHTTAGNTPIYIYNGNEDPGVSSIVRSTGSFQPELSAMICKLIESEPTAQFIDIGANIGVIALSVAKCSIGKPVIVVEPIVSNINRLCHSAKDGNFTDQITLLQTAMSNQRKYVNLGVFGNKACSYVLDKKDVKPNIAVHNGTVMTATLDDILTLPGFQKRKTFIKIDTEGHEYNVLDMGRNFFDIVDVRAVVVEWILFRNRNETAKKIIDFFKERKFTPYNYQTSQILSENVSHTWPHDVLFKPNIA